MTFVGTVLSPPRGRQSKRLSIMPMLTFNYAIQTYHFIEGFRGLISTLVVSAMRRIPPRKGGEGERGALISRPPTAGRGVYGQVYVFSSACAVYWRFASSGRGILLVGTCTIGDMSLY